ncbi:carbohydrate ABC transporter permease [Parenemella sanctibonifatiensis]|uniref:Sugar ABC transporter permease n=1 Tax=Parenemella sanctibonifatiensis TaxID=2016505 RepID=A0A255EKB9_9ACTN|nr:carbohydrate ABC transporter permease [Parenemella sanctibonifatiensis]OYN89892.1 sugar ABC transporter permease [Parenemella sanctibonifatiensis]
MILDSSRLNSRRRRPAPAASVSGLLRHGFLILVCVVTIYPLLWLVRSSLMTDSEIFSSTSLLPSSPTLSNYVAGWSANPPGFGAFLTNSMIVCLGAVVGNLVSCTLAAYAFARLRFPLRAFFFAAMLMTVMIPSQVTLIPQYTVFTALGWVNTYLPLIVPKLLATDAFFIFLLVQFIRGLPIELDEAAELDGCGYFGIFFRIILPLTAPALATTAVFTFIWTYEDFMGPLIYLSDVNSYTVPLGLRMFVNSMGQSAYGQLFAMSALTLVPVFIVFLLLQKRLVEGIATTGIKG